MIKLDILRVIAKNKLQKEVSSEEDLISFLEIWFTQKYNLPNNHPLFLEKTLEELVIDFYIDKFSSNPEELQKENAEKKDKEYEEYLKQQMGADYHEEYDFLVPPTKEDKKQESIAEEFEDHFGDE